MAKKPSPDPQRDSEESRDTNDLMREVQRDLREEQLLAFWRTYRARIIILAIALVASGIGVGTYIEQNKAQRTARAASYIDSIAAQQLGNAAANESILQELFQSGTNDFGMLAGFRLGNTLAAEGDFIQAGIVYAQLAGNKTIPENYRDLAALYNTMMLQDDVAFLQRITTWTAPSSPYSAIAQFALADRLALSDPVRAITALDAILDNAEASSSLKQQAAALKDVLIR